MFTFPTFVYMIQIFPFSLKIKKVNFSYRSRKKKKGKRKMAVIRILKQNNSSQAYRLSMLNGLYMNSGNLFENYCDNTEKLGHFEHFLWRLRC